MNPSTLAVYVKELAAALGFDLCGIARAERIARADYFQRWLDQGKAGTMDYMQRNFSMRVDPRQLLEGAKSVIMVAVLYHQQVNPEDMQPTHGPVNADTGRVARYAWGDDYHKVVKQKLFTLTGRLYEGLSVEFQAKACVDTAPLPEREFAALAGIGWIGKNTMVLHPTLGSYLFLGGLVTTLDIDSDEPMADHCGTCRACLDACPTDAFPNAYEMDASRCISYLTIEHRGDIPSQFHQAMGDLVFGCDICQEVCPFNRHAPFTSEPRFEARPPAPQLNLNETLEWTEDDYREKLRGSAMKRAKLDMLKRNARIALQNGKTAYANANECTAGEGGKR